jgi:DNA-directed RNA polymerase subunit RPC12/RpoP
MWRVKAMAKQTPGKSPGFKVVCITCGVKIRENASDDSYGMCLKCFYTMLAMRLRTQKRVAAGEFVSER